MQRWRALGGAALAAIVAAGLVLWIPGVSATAAALAGMVAGAITLGLLLLQRGVHANEEGAIGLHYQLVDVRFQEGLGYLDAGHTERALGFFDRAIEREPEHADAHFCKGLVHHQAGRYREAIADLDRAIELDPGHPYAHFQRGFVYYQLEQYEQAVADLTRAIEIRPDEWVYALRDAAHSHLDQRELADW